MVVVAGPPGSGKSTAFPVTASGIDYMNIDDVAARMNLGSYLPKHSSENSCRSQPAL